MFFTKKKIKLKTKSRTFKLLTTFFLLLVLLVGLYLVRQRQNLNSSAASACNICKRNAEDPAIECKDICKNNATNGCVSNKECQYGYRCMGGVCKKRESAQTPIPTKKPTTPTTREECLAQGESPSLCNKLPSCPGGGSWNSVLRKCVYSGGKVEQRPVSGIFTPPINACLALGGYKVVEENELCGGNDISRGLVKGCKLTEVGTDGKIKCTLSIWNGGVTKKCCATQSGLEAKRNATCTGKVDIKINGNVTVDTTLNLGGTKLTLKKGDTSGSVQFTGLKCVEGANSDCLDSSFDKIGNPEFTVDSSTQSCSIKGDNSSIKYYCCK